MKFLFVFTVYIIFLWLSIDDFWINEPYRLQTLIKIMIVYLIFAKVAMKDFWSVMYFTYLKTFSSFLIKVWDQE